MDDRKFRTAMGSFPTGVTVITTELDGDVHGMTANAFMSLSLQPKLVVISVDEKASMLQKVQQSKKYAVNILAEDQKMLSMLFAGQLKKEVEIDFDRLAGLPVIPGARAQVTCDVVNQYTEGDHTLFIGKVTDIFVNDVRPLLFDQGKYYTLPKEDTALMGT